MTAPTLLVHEYDLGNRHGAQVALVLRDGIASPPLDEAGIVSAGRRGFRDAMRRP